MSLKTEFTIIAIVVFCVGWFCGSALAVQTLKGLKGETPVKFIVGDLKLPRGQVDCSSVVFNAEDICGVGQIVKTRQDYVLFCVIIQSPHNPHEKEYHYFGSMDLDQLSILRQDFVVKLGRWMEWKDKQGSREVNIDWKTPDEVKEAVRDTLEWTVQRGDPHPEGPGDKADAGMPGAQGWKGIPSTDETEDAGNLDTNSVDLGSVELGGSH